MHDDSFHDMPARLARATLAWSASWGRVFEFGARALVMAASPSAYDRATSSLMARQIYFTAWEILPGFVLVCALLSYMVIRIVVAAAYSYGLEEFALTIVVRVLVLELIPMFVALFVALRSGAAINTEVALMHIRGDLAALQRAGADPMRHELVPRVVGSAVSVFALTVIGGSISLVLAYVAMYGWSSGGLEDYTHDMRFAPIAVLNGMVRLFLSLALIEGASLALRYL